MPDLPQGRTLDDDDDDDQQNYLYKYTNISDAKKIIQNSVIVYSISKFTDTLRSLLYATH